MDVVQIVFGLSRVPMTFDVLMLICECYAPGIVRQYERAIVDESDVDLICRRLLESLGTLPIDAMTKCAY
jgi:hypothetical protein